MGHKVWTEYQAYSVYCPSSGSLPRNFLNLRMQNLELVRPSISVFHARAAPLNEKSLADPCDMDSFHPFHMVHQKMM